MAQVIDREGVTVLDEIRQVLGLSESELADLFGVRRPSLTSWRSTGIPQGRRATAERLQSLARVLDRELIRSRIPEIVRTPDAWLGNRTMLEVLIAEGPDAVYGYLGRLFAYAEDA
ncbi:MAG: helix-turn-helix domain-containing protein [Candidatus Dormibacteraeota bacterium]|nr:helix-turn-helix domain-containing protein [Candidatus Dormibacteraeota bacterium]